MKEGFKKDLDTANLTLTRVVFEYILEILWSVLCGNLTLTRVVFELAYMTLLWIFVEYLTLTRVVFE